MKMGKRIVATALMLAVVLGTTIGVTSATNITYKELKSDAPVVMTVNGSEVRADEFATYMLYNMKYYENMYAQYGMTDLWGDESMSAMMGPEMSNAAKEQATYMRVMIGKFNEAGLKLTSAQQQQLKQVRTSLMEQAAQQQAMLTGVDVSTINAKQAYKDMIAGFGFTEQAYNNFMYASMCYDALNEHYFGANGTMGATDEEKLAYLNENYISAKHILISTIDPATGEAKRTDEEAKAEAQKALDRLKAGEDFDAVMKEVSEDTGLSTYPDGYIFTEGQMVTPFYEGAKALKEGEISGLVKSDYGYHIIMRMPIDFSTKLDEVSSDGATTYGELANAGLEKTMDAMLTEWMDTADVQTTDAFNEITYQNVYDYALVDKPTYAEDALAAAGNDAVTDENAATGDNAAADAQAQPAQ